MQPISSSGTKSLPDEHTNSQHLQQVTSNTEQDLVVDEVNETDRSFQTSSDDFSRLENHKKGKGDKDKEVSGKDKDNRLHTE